MKSTVIYSSSEYHIDSIELKSNINDQFYDLLLIYDNIQINESMTHTFIYGSISVTDTNGLIEILPIVGEETIKFKLKKTPGDKKYFEVKGQVYKISNRTKDPDRKGVERYTLDFISECAMDNQTKRVSKTYEGKISQAVKDITENFLGLKKIDQINTDPENNPKLYQDVLIENTMENNKVNVPNLKPVDAINFLTKFSYSQNNKDKNPYNTTYKFYQTRQGYFFQSVEKTILESEKNIKHKFIVGNDPHVKISQKQLNQDDLFTVMSYDFINLYDNFTSSNDGYYGGKNISYDTLTKTIHEYDLKYNDKFQELVHLDKNNTNTDDFIFNKEPEKTFIVSLPTKKGSNSSEYIKNKEKSKDIFYVKEDEIDILKSTKNERYNEGLMVQISIPGNPYLYVNDIIHLSFPSYERINNKKNYFDDKYFSGNYLVVSISHNLSDLDTNSWTMSLTLLKDTYKSRIE